MSEDASIEGSVARHYAVGELGGRILAALESAGADIDALTVDDLAPVDEFHIRGREATIELARLAGIGAGDEVLDAGCGIGGSGRYLAATFGCRVTGVDLTEDHIAVAQMLSRRVGMSDKVEFRRGNVLDLPFAADSFDIAWTEHAQMNVADKRAFYAELFRVTKPGGKLAFHDIFEGPEGQPHFPVPWAPDGSISHLISIEELRVTLGSTGFSQAVWEDKTAASTAFLHAALQRGPAEGGLPLIMDDAKTKLGNALRNLQEGRICVVQAVMRKPPRG